MTTSLPSTMSAVRLLTDTGPAGISVDQVDVPGPGRGDALVAVHAAALTRDELTWPVDRLPAVPSYELSGVVAAVGRAWTRSGRRRGVRADAVRPRRRGRRLRGGAGDLLAPRPQSVDHVQRAAIPLPGLTAWQALFDHGRLDRDSGC